MSDARRESQQRDPAAALPAHGATSPIGPGDYAPLPPTNPPSLQDLPPRPTVADATEGIPRASGTGKTDALVDFLPGDTFGDYIIRRLIARGGMGAVYEAEQFEPRRIVALKMIAAGQLASPSDVQRFRTEAEAAASLEHPSIVPIYQVGVAAGRNYFSMGYAPGGTLADRLERGPVLPEQAVDWAVQIADALEYAHSKGIVHRDLKPGNVLLGADGRPRVADFGIAKRLDQESMTLTGMVVGTPSYMPPEQARGDAKAVGPAADIYSLGAVLYCLLTGRPPFQAASSWETVRQVLEQEPAPPRQLNPAIPRDLETICLHCLRKEPARRYPSAAALAADLRRCGAGEAISVRPASRWERTRRWARKHPGQMAGWATAAALLLVSAAAVFADSQRQRTLAEERRQLAADAEISRAATARALYRSLLGQARGERLARRAGFRDRAWRHLREALALDLSNLDREEVRREAIACLGEGLGLEPKPAGSMTLHFPPTPGPEWAAAMAVPFSSMSLAPDGRYLAVSRPTGVEVWTRDPAGPKAAPPRSLGQMDAPLGGADKIAFANDCTTLVVGCVQGVLFVDAPKLMVTSFFRSHTINRIAAQPDGPLVALGDSQSRIELWSVASRRLVARLERPGDSSRLAFSADGDHLAAVPERGGAAVAWRVRGVPERLMLAGHVGGVATVAFSPDGHWLATGGKDHFLRIWNAKTGREAARMETSYAPQSAAFSADGKWLSVAAYGPKITIANLETGWAAEVDSPVGQTWRTAFASDGRLVLAGTEGAVLFGVVPVGGALRLELLATASRGFMDVVVRPDGKAAVLNGFPGQGPALALWDLAEPKKLRSLRGAVVGHESVGFLPGGQAVWTRDGDRLARVPLGEGPGETLPISARSLAVAADGRWAMAVGYDAVLRLVADRSSQPTLELPAENTLIWSTAFRRDAGQIAVGLSDGGVSIWDLGEIARQLRVLGVPLEQSPASLPASASAAPAPRLPEQPMIGAATLLAAYEAGQQRDWPKCRRLSQSILEAAPFCLQAEGNLALAWLAAGDRQAYARHARSLAAGLAQRQPSGHGVRDALRAILAVEGVVDCQPLRHVANWNFDGRPNLNAAVLLRAGDPAAALRVIETVQQPWGAWEFALRGLARLELGKPADAAADLKKAMEWLDNLGDWRDRQFGDAVVAELKAKLAAKQPQTAPASTGG